MTTLWDEIVTGSTPARPAGYEQASPKLHATFGIATPPRSTVSRDAPFKLPTASDLRIPYALSAPDILPHARKAYCSVNPKCAGQWPPERFALGAAAPAYRQYSKRAQHRAGRSGGHPEGAPASIHPRCWPRPLGRAPWAHSRCAGGTPPSVWTLADAARPSGAWTRIFGVDRAVRAGPRVRGDRSRANARRQARPQNGDGGGKSLRRRVAAGRSVGGDRALRRLLEHGEVGEFPRRAAR